MLNLADKKYKAIINMSKKFNIQRDKIPKNICKKPEKAAEELRNKKPETYRKQVQIEDVNPKLLTTKCDYTKSKGRNFQMIKTYN